MTDLQSVEQRIWSLFAPFRGEREDEMSIALSELLDRLFELYRPHHA